MRDHLAAVAYIEAREDWVFGYGRAPRTHDCARFVGGGVEAATGRNPLKRFSSEWTTRRGARRVLAAHGGMAAAVGEVLTPLESVTLARRWDVGMTADDTLVLIEGDTVVGLSPTLGQVRQPRSALTRAWSAD